MCRGGGGWRFHGRDGVISRKSEKQSSRWRVDNKFNLVSNKICQRKSYPKCAKPSDFTLIFMIEAIGLLLIDRLNEEHAYFLSGQGADTLTLHE